MEYNMKPKVSIIVPIYNVESYLDRCIQSLLNQTLKEIEIILVDDGSPDNCPAMCDEYAKQDNRIKVIHKKNAGLGYARNSGLEIAAGEYVAFVDSDDFVDINMYESLYSKAKSNHYDTVLCNCYFYRNEKSMQKREDINQETIFIGRKEVDDFLLDIIGPLPEYKHDVKYMMSVWHGIYSMNLIRKENLRFVSERDFISEDIIWDIDYLHKAQRVCYVPNCLYYYCLNENSLSRKYNPERYNKNKELVVEVKRKLSLLFEEEYYKIHFLRLMFLYLRNSLQYMAQYANSTQSIRNVLNDNFWKPLFQHYPYHQMDMKHRLFFMMLKFKIVFLLQICLNRHFKI